MQDTFLFWFWTVVAALFWFATIYVMLLMKMKTNPVTSQTFWTLLPIAVAFTLNALVRSGSTWFATDSIRIIYRTAILVSAVNAPIMVIALARSYNGSLSWRGEWDSLRHTFSGDREVAE